MIAQLAGTDDRQTPFDAAVVIPTVLRPSLAEAVQSVFAQDLPGRVQILIGIDTALGDRALLDSLAAECPARMAVFLFDPGYSTSVRHGGLHANRFGGALRTILSFAANSRHIAYLDDDNRFAPDHLSSLLEAVQNHDWAHSLRWMVDPDTGQPMYVDATESVGIGAGIWGQTQGGFVDTNCLMVNKLACLPVFHLWSHGPLPNGGGEDRLMFKALSQSLRGRNSGRASVYYLTHPDDPMHKHRIAQALRAGYIPAALAAP